MSLIWYDNYKGVRIVKIARVIFMALGMLVITNAVAASLVSNLHFGIVLFYILGIGLLAVSLFMKLLIKIIPKTIRYLLAVLCVISTIFMCFLYGYGITDTVTYTEDALVVLGAGIRGEALSDHLKNRLDAAVDYHTKNPQAVIVVSGGQGPEEDITESLAMERYLISQGIPAERIVQEGRAASTEENFRYSKELLDRHFDKPYSVVFITNDYHIYRAELIAQRSGFMSVSHCHHATPWSLILPNGLREMVAVVKTWILG